jgi:hypothetical protein
MLFCSLSFTKEGILFVDMHQSKPKNKITLQQCRHLSIAARAGILLLLLVGWD